MTERKTHLEELSHERYYEIAEDDPDIKHWNIVDEGSKKIGEVQDLLFDKEAKKVRYLITNLKHGMFEEDRKVLAPIGRARLDTANHRVVLPKVTRHHLALLPNYTKPEDLTEEDERAIRHSFAGSEETGDPTEPYNRETFYDHEDFNESKYYKKEG